MLGEKSAWDPRPPLAPHSAIHDSVPGPAPEGVGGREGGTQDGLPPVCYRDPSACAGAQGHGGDKPTRGGSARLRLAFVSCQVMCPLGSHLPPALPPPTPRGWLGFALEELRCLQL